MGTPRARILAIDDQLYFRSFLEGLLGEEGFDVRTEPGGPGILELLERHGPFDLVILDVAMAETDGVATIARLRERAPGTGVIVVSGVGDVRSVVAAMAAGAADYLLKPIDRESLLESVERVLGRARVDPHKLVDENLEFMGRVSELERALALVGSADLPTAAQGVLEMLAGVAGGDEGVLWVAEAAGGGLLTGAALGRANDDTLPRDWVPEDEALTAAMREGRPHFADGVLHLPCMRDEELVAVARIGTDGGLAEDVADACMRLCGICAGVLRSARLLTASGARGGASAGEPLRDPESGLPAWGFFELSLATEVHKAQRYGRRLSCICVDAASRIDSDDARRAAVEAVEGTLRTSDVLASEGGGRFWVLVTDNDALGGVVLKRRLADRVRRALGLKEGQDGVAVGMASYPQDADHAAALRAHALASLDSDRGSLVHDLGLRADAPLAEMGEVLLRKAPLVPDAMVAEVAELLVGELSCRPRDRGLLFMAPGAQGGPILAPLRALGDTETATEVFLASDGDTLPCGPTVTAVMLPSNVPPEYTWIVRFGEGPPYALVAGKRRRNGKRPLFHTGDPVLVEHLTFRLRSDVGFGVRTGCGY